MYFIALIMILGSPAESIRFWTHSFRYLGWLCVHHHSPARNTSFLTIAVADDYSQCAWINCLMKFKYETRYSQFEFCGHVKDQFLTTNKKIRTDNGSEFLSCTRQKFSCPWVLSHNKNLIFLLTVEIHWWKPAADGRGAGRGHWSPGHLCSVFPSCSTHMILLECILTATHLTNEISEPLHDGTNS